MADQSTLFDIDRNVGIIRLNRPDRLNALTPGLLREIRSYLDEAGLSGIKAILLTGEGRAFCAGADLAGEGLGGKDPGTVLAESYHPLFRRLMELDIPIVSAINGPAVGAGAALAMAADISVMARSAYLQFGFVNVGLVPDSGVSWLLARSVGRVRALELTLLGERVEAEAALAMGLVTRVSDDADCFDAAFALAQRLASGPSVAIGLIRKQVLAALNGGHEDVLGMEVADQRRAGETQDFREGVAAFREKRLPAFKGH